MNKEEINLLSEQGTLKGIYDDISNEDYHSCVGVSKSGLMLFDRDPVKFHYKYIKGHHVSKSTEALTFGKLLHEVLLEPEFFYNTYRSDSFALELGSRQTKVFKEAVADYLEEYPKKQIIKHDIYQKLVQIKNAVYKNPLVKQILELKGKSEQTIFWTDPTTKILCKCRLDKFVLDQNIDDYKTKNFIIEVKSTTDVFEFEHSIAKYKYYLQDAWYRAGAKFALDITDIQPIFIAIDKEEPFHCRVGQIDIVAEGLGKKVARSMLNNLSASINDGFLFKPMIETFEIPEYELRRQESKIEE